MCENGRSVSYSLWHFIFVFLTEIADVDLGSASKTQIASVIDEVSEGSEIKSRYFDFDLTNLFSDTLTALGQSLGVKYGAVFVDSILADLILASQSMPSGHDALPDWLHKWIGSLVVVRSVMKGAFTSGKGEEDDDNKKAQRRLRVIVSFASSIFPLLLRSQLWGLPTPLERGQSFGPGDARSGITPLKLQSNTCVVVLLLEFFRDLSRCLKSSIERFLPTILYPLVEKASQGNIASVRLSALQALQAISLANEVPQMETSIVEHQILLVSAMMGQLRISGGSQIPRQADKEKILHVSQSALWVLGCITRSNCCVETSTMIISTWMDLVDLLHARLAHLFVQQVLMVEEICDICRLYSSYFRFLLFKFGADDSEVYTFKMIAEQSDPKQAWRDALAPYRKFMKDGFHSEVDKKIGEGEEPKYLDLSEKDVELCSKLNAQGCYLLSNASLKIRVMACDSLTLGFQFLAFVGTNHEVRLQQHT
jgi:hypothetical protein